MISTGFKEEFKTFKSFKAFDYGRKDRTHG
jgi:hypothetical protein